MIDLARSSSGVVDVPLQVGDVSPDPGKDTGLVAEVVLLGVVGLDATLANNAVAPRELGLLVFCCEADDGCREIEGWLMDERAREGRSPVGLEDGNLAAGVAMCIVRWQSRWTVIT